MAKAATTCRTDDADCALSHRVVSQRIVSHRIVSHRTALPCPALHLLRCADGVGQRRGHCPQRTAYVADGGDSVGWAARHSPRNVAYVI
ncbi:hypothetical protein [Roseateles amylovorans]|uniref:Uncharacterized protein n=1 Tax=Roseateles amylovorans TaxID=2978473 RepID=A0ABY6AUM7_9BURK|nr:hypothetical protein [Roseateles amylovorans]UXH76921.1 hypothetical protein N4261_18070 [Roseateles amylovorans]